MITELETATSDDKADAAQVAFDNPPDRRKRPADIDLYMRYLGVLKLLENASPHVDDEDRESIEMAFDDAVANYPLRYRRVLNRFIIEPLPEPAPAPKIRMATYPPPDDNWTP